MTSERARSRAHRYTVVQYRLLPEGPPYYELLDGVLLLNPTPATLHQIVSRRLQYALMTALEVPGVADIFNAPTDVELDQYNVVQPDLVIVKRRRRLVQPHAIVGSPDVIIEILSPSNPLRDTHVKRALYAEKRVREYWIVDPRRAYAEVFVLSSSKTKPGYRSWKRFERADTLRSPAFAQLAVPLAPVFAR